MGHLLVIWSARLVVLFYFLRLAFELLVDHERRRQRWGLLAWTAGCAVLLVHLGLAFHFEHHWSHAAALAHTARRTFEVTGVDWGGGIYFNYAFALLWVADVLLWRRRARRGQPTPRPVFWGIQAVFAFMMFNATVVFGPAFWRAVVPGSVLALLMARLLLRRAPRLRPLAGQFPGSDRWK
jgi:hypothetical protein